MAVLTIGCAIETIIVTVTSGERGIVYETWGIELTDESRSDASDTGGASPTLFI